MSVTAASVESSAADARTDLLPNSAFRAVFDSSSEALIVTDKSGSLQIVNERARKLLQFKHHGGVKTQFTDLLGGSARDHLSSLSRGQTLVTSAPLADGPGPNHRPIRVTLRAILPISQHLLLSLEQHSAQPTSTEWLEAGLRAVLDSVQLGILILDRRGRIRMCSPRFAELFGLPMKQVEKIANLDDLSPLLVGRLRDPDTFFARWREFSSGHGEPAHEDFEVVGPPNRLLQRFSQTIMDAEEHNLGWLEVYSDVTEYRRIQSKMSQNEKMVVLGQFVAGIAHELNNPLTAIIGNVQLLLGERLQAPALTQTRKVYQEAERARRIVKNLLYFARENKPARSAVDLNEIVERTLMLRSYDLKNENIRVETNLAPDLPKTMADPYQLQQVVFNLLINAEQVLLESRGQGLVKISTRHSTHKSGRHIVLELSDDGPGISPEIGPRIFDPFFTTKAPGVGTGLGLSIVYGIVRQHDGEVTFENLAGSGARFIVELPVTRPPAMHPNRKLPKTADPWPAVKPSRVLVIEDEPTVADLIVDVLEEEGHRANAVSDGREGLEFLSRHSYDLVICDLRMPHLDGRLFFATLKRAGDRMRHRILFITGDTLTPSTLAFLNENRLPYVTKPFLVEELKLAVREQLRARNREVDLNRRQGDSKAFNAASRNIEQSTSAEGEKGNDS